MKVGCVDRIGKISYLMADIGSSGVESSDLDTPC